MKPRLPSTWSLTPQSPQAGPFSSLLREVVFAGAVRLQWRPFAGKKTGLSKRVTQKKAIGMWVNGAARLVLASNFGTAIGLLPRLLTMPSSSSLVRPSKRCPRWTSLSLERFRANA